MKHNEDTRVKIPTILHLINLGYEYLSLKTNSWDKDSNIFKDIFLKNICKINKDMDINKANEIFERIKLELTNNDLGYEFYNHLLSNKDYKIIDFENVENNSFNVVTELTYKKDDEEFRPDITILINGLPLTFIEVKKPNNKEGIYAEKNRINKRFKNKKFRSFFNITQFIIFSNNMEYDENSSNLFQGAFYASSSYNDPKFNFFREENSEILNKKLKKLNEDEELFVLKDNNLLTIKNSKEYLLNKDLNTPTKKICSSLLSKERLFFILRYGLTYVVSETIIEKHIIRYPQLFAMKAINSNLEKKINKGIIWHTQGSGKTALTYFCIKFLKDNFYKKNINTKFYFIVDRIDLLEQASREFKKRGLSVYIISSREEFVENLRSKKIVHNDRGNLEIILVNIQRFENDHNVIVENDYNIEIQRIYFLDEVHRSYKPKGSFLTNLHLSDKNSIKIGLTGTPLIGKESNSRNIFGNYIHRYFYNSSINDGYTLRLIREEIDSQYKQKMNQILSDLEIKKGQIKSNELYSKKKYIERLLDYIYEDFEKSKIGYNDNSIGAMIVCSSHQQAENMYNLFNEKNKGKSALILYDAGTKEERKIKIEDFKDGKIDYLFVYNMLLTGFDAPRLKKIYFTRVIKAHNLLQALTRVNRPYNKFKFGYVVDFADIHEEFKKTNQAYFDELKNEFGDEIEGYENLFKTEEEIKTDIDKINQKLFNYDVENLENFSRQISQIDEKKELVDLSKILNTARELYNVIRISGKSELLKNFDFSKISFLYKEVSSRLDLINQKEILENQIDNSSILNLALEDIIFSFKKIKEEELIMSDELREILRKTRENLAINFDTKDPEFIKLRDELERLFKNKNMSETNKDEMTENINQLEDIFNRSKNLNRKNDLIKSKYENDEKYSRIHKRLNEKGLISNNEITLFNTLINLKYKADQQILKNTEILNNEAFVKQMIKRITTAELVENKELKVDLDNTEYLSNLIFNEYINEYNGITY